MKKAIFAILFVGLLSSSVYAASAFRIVDSDGDELNISSTGTVSLAFDQSEPKYIMFAKKVREKIYELIESFNERKVQ